MILNRFEDAVACKSRLAFYLKKGYRTRIKWDNQHCFYPTMRAETEFVGGLKLSDIINLITNVIR